MMTDNEQRGDKLWLTGIGNTEGRILIVCSHPTYEDYRQQELHYRSDELTEHTNADELMDGLRVAGISEDDCFFTSMVKYGIGNQAKPTPKQIEECSAELDIEIAEIKPKLIIALGAETFKRLMKQNISPSDYMGEIIESPYGPLMATYAPGQIHKVDPTLRPDFYCNFQLAKRFVDGTLRYKPYEYLVVDTPEVNTQILQHYIDTNQFSVGYDAEWVGKFRKGEKMYTFQYSCEPGKAIVLPLITEKDGEENLELLNTMKLLLEHPKADRLGWNIRADDKRLRDRGFNLPDETLGFDGMKAVAFFDSRWGKGLETGIKKFTNYRPYYNEFFQALRKHKIPKERMSELLFKDKKLFYDYCAGDAVSHREACLNMRSEMKEKTHPAVVKYFEETYLPLSNYLLDMELTGIPIDVECMTKLTAQYNECYNKLYADLMEKTRVFGFNTVLYELSEAEIGEDETKAKGIYPDFNPRSTKHKQLLFFDLLKLTPAYYVKKGKTKPKAWYDKAKPATQKQYNPSANGKSMASIRFQLAADLKKDPDNKELQQKYDIVRTYLDLARVSVFSHKFFSTKGVDLEDDVEGFENDSDALADGESPLKSSYWAGLADDLRIHADFYECLDNFRSSSKPNVQNPASKVLSHIPAIFERCNLETPKNIRNIFYSGDKDWYFAEVDVAGADLAIAAFLSKDKDYINDILKGGFHTTKMREYFKDPNLSKNDASKYVTAKSITFRVAYTAGLMSAALPIQAEIYAESGELVDISLIEYALATWKRYTTYMEYREQCQREVEQHNCITNMRKMVYHFDYTNDPAIKAGWINQSLAYPIASELALFMWDISVQLKEQMKKDKVWMNKIYPVNVVHDANYWVIHKDLMNDNYFPEVCKFFFTDHVKIATGDNLGMEMVVSDRWKGKQKIFAKETKWSFEKKCWEWEK